ncbi:hypothetical protein E4U12_003820 [Claviceps purpurea]|nr:hypothetical protein E4U12_003820 [Claviceps purpurea]
MVQITSVIVAVMVAVTPMAQASRHLGCKPGFNYCGRTLFNQLYDAEKIVEEAKKLKKGFVKQPYESFLFHCNDDESITAVSICNYFCRAGGEGKNDACS